MLVKSPTNPILGPISSLWWSNKKVYNAASFVKDNVYTLVYRAIGDDYISRLGMASSLDGVNFRVQEKPIFEPLNKYELHGCEDPRITLINDTYWMAYTAYDGLSARAALTSTKDFVTWSERHILFPTWKEGRWVSPAQNAWSKAAAIFPEKIGRKYKLFFGDDNIWEAESEDLIHWQPSTKPALKPREGLFDSSYIEMGPPPIKTKFGWLIVYHGIDGRDDSRVYRLGAAIMDYADPSVPIWRCKKPILEPSELFERVGMIDIIDGGMQRLSKLDSLSLNKLSKQNKLPQAIFCCGAIAQDDNIQLYYSGSDTVLCLATGSIEDIIKNY